MVIKMNLRLRITLLVGLILVLVSTALTFFSIQGAQHYFVNPQTKTPAVFHKEVIQESSSDFIGEFHAFDPNNTNNISTTITAQAAQKNFSTQSIVILGVINIVGLVSTYFIVGRALKPLTALSMSIRDINEHNLNKTIEVPTSKDEISSLTHSFNGMLNRLKLSFDSQKRFAANAAHELKTPLATMKASLQVLKLDEYPSVDEYKENNEIAEKSIERLIGVVNDLLLLSSDAEMDFLDEISIATLFKEIKQELSEALMEKNIDVVMPELDYIMHGNKTLLRNAFFNIVENAVKYNKQNGSIKVDFSKTDNGKALISVSDTGVGIATEKISHVLEPFYREDTSRSKEIPGNGLGLSIAKTIIEKHNGELLLESEVGVGTKVTVVLVI